MIMEPPSFIVQAGVIGAPARYKWNNDLSMEFDDAENDRLLDAVDRCGYRAKMAVAVTLTEWIVWRFQGLTDISDSLLRIQASWAAVVDVAYTRGIDDFTLTPGADFHDTEKVRGPLEVALSILAETVSEFSSGSIYLADPVMRQSLLAMHLMPDKKFFEGWLSQTLRATSAVFPRKEEYDEESEVYDPSDEIPVPRQFFEPGFVCSDAALKGAVSDFLRTLDPQQNPYLRNAQEMVAHGFKGIPYKV